MGYRVSRTKLERKKVALDMAARRHAKWGLARPSPRVHQMSDEAKLALDEAAKSYASELSDVHAREMVRKGRKAA